MRGLNDGMVMQLVTEDGTCGPRLVISRKPEVGAVSANAERYDSTREVGTGTDSVAVALRALVALACSGSK